MDRDRQNYFQSFFDSLSPAQRVQFRQKVQEILAAQKKSVNEPVLEQASFTPVQDITRALISLTQIVEGLQERQTKGWDMLTASNLLVSEFARLLQASNARVDELEQRLAALEAKLNQ